MLEKGYPVRYYRRYYDEDKAERVDIETALEILRENHELSDKEIRDRLDSGEIMESRTAFYYAREDSYFFSFVRRMLWTAQ